jgi:hypothetical protein
LFSFAQTLRERSLIIAVTFVSKIEWPKNDLLIPAEWFGVQVPTGLDGFHVRSPNYVDVMGMSRVTRNGSSAAIGAGGQLGSVNGLVSNDLQVRFDNVVSQWQCTPLGGPTSRQGPGQFRFTGGNVSIVMSLGIYILDLNKPNLDDQLSVDIFAEVYSHELLHVLDEIDIVRNWLIPRLNPDPTIAQYLIRAEPYVFGTPSQSIMQVEQEFRTHIQKTIQANALSIWAVEANRRQGLRDAPAEYKKVQDRIDVLRGKQINR